MLNHIVVMGRLQIRDWTDKEGGKRRTAEIVANNVYFGDSKIKEGQEPPASAGGPVEAAGGDGFSLPESFSPNFEGRGSEENLPF